MLRSCFRGPSAASLDAGFSALRTVGTMSTWLDFSSRLNSHHLQHDPVGAGALTIAEAIDLLNPETHRDGARDAAEAPSAKVLDELADATRRRLERDETNTREPCSRLLTLAAINSTLFDEAGFVGEVPAHVGGAGGPPIDIASLSSLSRVLHRRRGLPIALCVIYEAVGARLGLELSFTNFPGCVLLRMEAANGSKGGDMERPGDTPDELADAYY